MRDWFTYRHLIAYAIIIGAVWIGVILYRVGRGDLIRRIDFWKSKWKIVLFWIVIVAIIIVAWYFLDRYELLEYFQ